MNICTEFHVKMLLRLYFHNTFCLCKYECFKIVLVMSTVACFGNYFIVVSAGEVRGDKYFENNFQS